MREVTVQLFKESGKYYSEIVMTLPEEVLIFKIPEYVNNHLKGRFCGMHIYISGNFEGMYPMMIPSSLRV